MSSARRLSPLAALFGVLFRPRHTFAVMREAAVGHWWVVAVLTMLIVLIYGGFLYITSAGNADNATKGKTAIINAIIGIVIIVLSYVIVQIVFRFVTGQGGGVTGP